ncbi:hypothetical protein [Hugenholtzia roseola]|uniref:hypothetical protein n=1 Tax=Hugenholtzia roseola TaxID=1002 RepID=UPI00040A8725|nr:hypothetical protein [Hugenholtzia roseola]
MENFSPDTPKETRIAAFCSRYEIEDAQKVADLYEIDELVAFLPTYPTDSEKQALQQLLGVAWIDSFYGYMDWHKSTNTFELIMQWREKTGNYD